MRTQTVTLATAILALTGAVADAQPTDELRGLVTTYLYGSGAEKADVLSKLADCCGDPIALVQSCVEKSYGGRSTGKLLDERFELPYLRELYPEDVLNFLVPESYDPTQPTGLLILLHGGGWGTPRTVAENWLREAGEKGGAYHFGTKLAQMPYISVAPSNLLIEGCSHRWSLPESDAYLLAVIEEACYRYNIDADRIYLVGQSMGGFGAYHAVQTIGDRFATIGAHGGAWRYGFWEGLHGTDFYIIHGFKDAEVGVRKRNTDVPYARFASACLSGYHIPHTYVEHQGGHSFTDPLAREAMNGFLEALKDRRRDPHPPKVVTASSKGCFKPAASPDFFWVSIDEATAGEFELDGMRGYRGSDDPWALDFRHAIQAVEGGVLRATNNGDNTLTVETRNIARFSLWLHPQMVDFSKPVKIIVDDEVCFEGSVVPSLATVLQSFDRRRDPGMLFCVRVELELRAGQTTACLTSPAPCLTRRWGRRHAAPGLARADVTQVLNAED